MEFLRCPFCSKFVVVSLSYPEDLQKTMCKKCFKVFYVQAQESGIAIYREEEIIVNKANGTVILKKTIDAELTPQFEESLHQLNEKLTNNSREEKDNEQN